MSDSTPELSGILVDTSVCRQHKCWAVLCELAKDAGVRVFISTITLGEMLAHLRRRKGEGFARSVVADSLRALHVGVHPIDEGVADTFAQATAQRFPADQEWNRAKQRQCHQMLHIAENLPFERVTTVEHCSGTSDWFIAATAVHHGLLMVTQDTGPEWGICAKASMKEAKEMLEARLRDTP